jgi:dipeptidyl aminopeptidase/acylaminoacyl peptidase
LDHQRVCVYGGSYGGYMVLASLVHYSDRLKAGIELMGISHFVTYLENTSIERRASRRQEFGDESDPKMRAFLNHISPLTNAAKIQKPLYVLQGLHDPRVPASEAKQMVEVLKQSGKIVWYSLFRDEGHGLTNPANSDFFVYSATLFLKQFLL